MDEHRRRWGRSLPAGLLGMVLLVVAVETFVETNAVDTVGLVSWQYRFASREATRGAADSDVVCFGDSLIKVGVIPRVLEGRYGLRCYNLAACGGQATTSYYLLRRALSGGARPRAVLVDFIPSGLMFGPRLNTSNFPHFLSVFECLDLGLGARDPGLAGELLAGRLIPSVRSREILRAFLAGLVSGRRGGVRYDVTWARCHWANGRGAHVLKSGQQGAVDPAVLQASVYPPSWASDPVNDAYVDRFLRLAAAHGTTVYWALPPVPASVQAGSERSGFDRTFVAYVQSWQKRYANLVVLDGRHTGYDPAVFARDPIHLGREGAFVFSVDVGALIHQHLSAPPRTRWIALPTYRALPAADDVRDDMACRLAVWGDPRVRR